MNDHYIDEPVFSDLEPAKDSEIDACVRRNPGTAILIAVGAGLALGLLARALKPAPSPQHRFSQLLEDLEVRLRAATRPALRKVGTLASEGADVLKAGAHSGEARFERVLRDANRRWHGLFS